MQAIYKQTSQASLVIFMIDRFAYITHLIHLELTALFLVTPLMIIGLILWLGCVLEIAFAHAYIPI